MVFFGLTWMARGLAIQYGDGLANNAFWLSDMYWYNRFGKVNIDNTSQSQIMIHNSIAVEVSH